MLEPVDMGLPSGLLWSSVDLDYTKPGNVAETPFTYMKSFFSWGNIDGHNPFPDRNRFAYNWGGINSQAPWYNGQVYGSTPGASLEGNIPLSMDAAQGLLGSPWRMPVSSDFKELIDNCDFVQADGTTVIDASQSNKRVTVNGVSGIYLKSKINGALLFFACSGFGNGTNWNGRISLGLYWSASFNSDRNANYLYFDSSGVLPQYNGNRFYGLAIRPVYDPSLL